MINPYPQLKRCSSGMLQVRVRKGVALELQAHKQRRRIPESRLVYRKERTGSSRTIAGLRKFENISAVFIMSTLASIEAIFSEPHFGTKGWRLSEFGVHRCVRDQLRTWSTVADVVLEFQPGAWRSLRGQSKYPGLTVAGEAGCTFASRIMMAPSYPSMFTECGPAKPDMVIRLLHHLPDQFFLIVQYGKLLNKYNQCS